MAEQTTFKELNQMNVNDHVEQKMGLTYLSWAWAHQEMKKIDDKAAITIHSFADPDMLNTLSQNGTQVTPEIIEATKINYRKDKAGAYVKVSVTLNGKTETEHLPVMDYRNKAMVNPDSMSINKAHKRCFVKALALHGLGLYLYAGEDLPEQPKPQVISDSQKDELRNLISQYGEATGNTDNESIEKLNHWALGQAKAETFSAITQNQFNQLESKLRTMIENKRSNEQESLFEGRTNNPKEVD